MRVICTVLVHFMTPAILLAQQPTQRWSATRDLRIGSADDPTQSLTTISSIVIGPQGNIYVAQPQDRLIRVFDRTGRFVRAIGRQGRGPGEFESPRYVGFLADTLYVSDSRLNRVNFFKADGTFLKSSQLTSPQVGTEFRPAVPLRLFSDGTALVMPSFPSAAIVSGAVTKAPHLRIDRNGKLLGTIAWRRVKNSQHYMQSGDTQMYGGQPYSDDPLIAVTPDGRGFALIDRDAARGDPGEFRVTRLGAKGDTTSSRSYRYKPVALMKAAIDSLVDIRAEGFMRNERPLFPSRAQAEDTYRKALYVPSFLPPVMSALFADDGALWLRRENNRTMQNWEIHDRTGAPIATVSLPPGLTVHVVQPDAVWGVELDELDVPYVVRYRLNRSRS